MADTLWQKLKNLLKNNTLKNQASFFHKLFLRSVQEIHKNAKYDASFNARDSISFISTHFFETASIISTTLFSINSWIHIYVTFLEEFINYPSITVAYTIYNFPFVVLKGIADDFEKVNKVKDEILKLMNTSSNRYIKFHIDKEFLDAIFSDPPESVEINDTNIFDLVLQYPKLSNTLLENMTNIFESQNMERAVLYSKLMISKLFDISVFFGISKCVKTLIPQIFKLCTQSTNYESFEPLFVLFIHILYSKWNSGLPNNRQYCLNFVLNEINDPQIRYFIYFFLVCATPEAENPRIKDEYIYSIDQINNETPIKNMSTLFIYLMTLKKEPSLKNVANLLKLHNILWLPVMTWSIIYRPKMNFIESLLSIPYYNTDVLKSYFYIMMIHISPPFQVWIGAQSFPNYDVKVRFPPPSLNMILQTIKSDIIITQTVKTLHDPSMVNILLSWRAYINIFGFKLFFEKLLDFLRHFVISRPDSVAISSAYKVAAMLVSSAIRSLDVDVGEAIISYAKNSLVDLRNPIYFSIFSILLLLNYKERDKNFPIVYQYIDEVLSLSQTASSPQTIFALSFLRNSLSHTVCTKYVDPKFLGKLISLNDWQTAIDIYLLDISHPQNQ
ncbi:hypothetical protein TRFO_21557 [Tritrichomonas foetus]|uniref:Uncharacterized protein n=1 Tax=Tritrichomonas foetus TaxID=1144522 RepID=A0A1J4KDJ4_9EUKA|nr:hypothetical protein TRFO_21557 [Tritrichomonas foetus]|eukprot:OHT09511.1 hypothetical protein TRFO_21557 [Tritrichomonas foetus]